LSTEVEPDVDDLDPLEIFLDCEGVQDETLETILDAKIPDSCKWIEKRQYFQEWASSTDKHIWLYWLHGSPGTGKSVTSAHVINVLQDADARNDVVDFFFVSGHKFHQDVATLLRCIAVRMAEKHKLVNQALRHIQKSGTHFEDAEAKTIWQKIFVSCILKLPLGRPQYWVIDALDECRDFGKLFPLLKTAQVSFPLRIFMTSRFIPDIRYSVQRLPPSKVRVTTDSVTPEDTEEDIRRLIKSREQDIPSENDRERAETSEKIVRNSQGSFLWVNVILRDMKDAYTFDEIKSILADVPTDMVPHYENILRHMSTNHPEREQLIRAILTWAVCSARPLETNELQEALKLHIGENVTLMKKAVEDFCGQLLIINKHGAVQLIHSTVREFLVDQTQISAYTIDREAANFQLARTCLKCLASEDLRRRPFARRRTDMTEITERVGPLVSYAATQFSLHLVRGPADNDELMDLLFKFLRSPNVLHWIEFVALKFRSLEHIKEAGANLRRYLERRSKHRPRYGTQFETVQKWSVDLIRVVSKFGRQILDSPSQMPLLVPPICPPVSAIYEQFHLKNPELHVVGISDRIWADAISYIDHVDTIPTSMACGTHYVAIGHGSGLVRIFNKETIVELAAFNHGERIMSMKFNNLGLQLVTSGPTQVTYWDLSESSQPREEWTKDVLDPCISFFFTDDDQELLATTKGNYLLILPLDDEEDPNVVPLTLGTNKPRSDGVLPQPKYTCFSPDGTRVAAAYDVLDGGRPIYLWKFNEGESSFLGRCGRPNADVQGILFNPNPDLEHLVVTYKEGVLALIDYNTLEEDKFVQAEPFSLTATLDGQTLATGSSNGFIELWDFETLTLLYMIKYHSESVADLRFSRDGRRLFDIRSNHSVVWEPAVLVRNTDEDEYASDSGCSVSYKFSKVDDYEDPVEISAVAVNPSVEEAIVGKEDGSVSVYNLSTGQQNEELFNMGSWFGDDDSEASDQSSASTTPKAVSHIALNQDGFLACASTTGQVLIAKRRSHDVQISESTATKIQTFELGEPLLQLIFSKSGEQLLVSGSRQTQIWEFDADSTGFILASEFNSPNTPCWRYFACPDNPNQFQCIDRPANEFLPIDAVNPWDKGMVRADSVLSIAPNATFRIRNAVVDSDTKYLVVEYEGAKSSRHLLVLEKTQARRVSEPGLLSPPMSPMAVGDSTGASALSDCYSMVFHLKPSQMKMFLGLHMGKAVYLGPHLWIRTLDLVKSVRKKHFFIPHEYIGGNNSVQAVVGSNGEMVFPRRGELAIIHGGQYYFAKGGQ
jgi:WD40 repeat protein